MAETTNPEQTGVGSDDVSKMAAFLDKWNPEDPRNQNPPEPSPAPALPAEVASPPESPAEPTPADLEIEAEPQPPVDEQAFEITHNGTQHKLNRDDVIRYAQQGFDYTQKTQAVAEASRAAQERLQQAEALEQVQAAVADDLGAVRALAAQLQQYQGVDWIQLAVSDTSRYAQLHAQYSQLMGTYNGAVSALEQKVGAVKQAKIQMTSQALQREAAKLPDLIPEWKDPAKYGAGRTEVLDYLVEGVTKAGGDPKEIGRYLDSAYAVATCRKAMLYDRLVAARAGKSKQVQNAPPMTRPGAAQPSNQAQAEQQKALMTRLRKSGSNEDAAALLLSRSTFR